MIEIFPIRSEEDYQKALCSLKQLSPGNPALDDDREILEQLVELWEKQLHDESEFARTASLSGCPSFLICGLSVVVHGYEYPDALDADDGNWLFATAQCKAYGARVKAYGPFLRTEEISAFLNDCESLLGSMTGRACLETMEPYLFVEIKLSKGKGTCLVRITPSIGAEHAVEQEHEFLFQVDQSYLPSLILGTKAILEKFPMRRFEKR